MRFLHTADWQIGMRAAHVGAGGETVRRMRFASAERVVAVARERGADAMLVAGDTFEDNTVTSADVQRVADILASFGRPVYVIPGNHDPAIAASLWNHAAWRREGLHVLLEPAPVVAAPGVTLYPCPLKSKYSTIDPTAWIAGAGGDGVRVGLAHGTVEGATVVEPVFPIARDAATKNGLDFLALGHWHSRANFDGPLASTRMAYAGTHEQTKFGEERSGNVLLIDLDGPGIASRVESVATGGLDWRDLSREVRSEVDLDALVAELEAIAVPSRTLLRLRLSGLLTPAALARIDRLRDLLEARFTLYFDFDDRDLAPEPGDASWIESLPLGIVRDVAEKLLVSTSDGAAARAALAYLYGHARKADPTPA